MEKNWLFIIGIVVIIIITAIAVFGITSLTGSVVYGKCWQISAPLSQSSEAVLKMQGCIIDNASQKVCCPLDSCPTVEGIKCGP